MAFNKRNFLFNPESKTPFRLSRSKVELFLDCPRCFWMDRRYGIKRPDFPAFTLNSAVDHLLKKEFDIHRKAKSKHPLLDKYGVDAIPFSHPKLEDWRHNFTGINFVHKPTNLNVFGAIDDVWINPKGELIIVDYKATAKDTDPDLEGPWQQAYKRQMEIYMWLFKSNDFKVSKKGYFVYVNGKRDRKAFDGKLEFDVLLILYEGNTDWVEKALLKAKETLVGDLPKPRESCEYCVYRKSSAEIVESFSKKDHQKIKKDEKKTEQTALF